jgi:hypothetical protein
MPFPLELDHVVVFVSVNAPEAKTLEALGLKGFGGTTLHGNLGTASTSFFFENTYLELFWVHDEAAATKALAPVGFDMHARINWREAGVSPFGLMLRRRLDSVAPLPFSTRRLKAEWMPGDVFLDFAADNSAEPYYGVAPESLTYTSFRSNIPNLPHPLGVRRLTQVRITVQSDVLSPIAQLLTVNGLATIEAGASPLLELIFDDGAEGKTVDIRPALPLVLTY